MNKRQEKKLIKAENFISLPLKLKRLSQRQRRWFRKTMKLYYKLNNKRWRNARRIICAFKDCQHLKDCTFDCMPY